MNRLNHFSSSEDEHKRLDLQQARLSHLRWELSLHKSLESLNDILPVWPSEKECDVGIWLQDRGLAEFHDFLDIKQVEIQHILFHQTVDACYLAIQHQSLDEFGQLRKQLSQVSKEILYLLTLLELNYRQAHLAQNRPLSPLQELVQIFSPSNQNNIEQELHLNVFDARLFHLLWIQDEMTSSFKNHGHNIDLSRLERCDLGVWIHDVGLKKFAHLKEVHQLNDIHQAFHEHSRVVLGALRHRRFQSAENAYGQLLSLSRGVIYWLTRVEMQLDEKKRHTKEW